jgi:hypothetical protein
MSRCPGLHCEGCGDHGGVALVAAVAVLAVTGAAIHAAWHAIMAALEIAVYAVCAAVALAAICGIGCAALSIRGRMASSRARPVISAPATVIRLGGAPKRHAVEAPCEIHPYGLTPDQLAAIVRHHTTEG